MLAAITKTTLDTWCKVGGMV